MNANSQTVDYIPLAVTNWIYPVGFAVQPNQIVTLVSHSTNAIIIGHCPQGQYLLNQSSIYAGLTNVTLGGDAYDGQGFATFAVTTLAAAAVVTNYVPADAIVIPSSATGTVQIILESSPDLVNWTAASPGFYGPDTTSNRFFRVRASTQ